MGRKELMETGGLTEGEMAALCACCRGDDEECLALAAALTQAGFTRKETEQYLSAQSGSEKKGILERKRAEVLKEIHRQNATLSKVDFLLWEGKHGRW